MVGVAVVAVVNGSVTCQTAQALRSMVAGDSIATQVAQTSGATLTIDWDPTFGGAHLSMVWMGPAG
jgi:hypothetical protein